MHISKYKNSFWIIIISLLISCSDGENGLNSLIKTGEELAGNNCEFGGLKIDSGIDTNDNGSLDPEEILNTDFVCSNVEDLDDQIQFTLLSGFPGIFTSECRNNNVSQVGSLIKFNKTYWVGVDSILFIPNLSPYTSGGTAYAELYNLTDNEVVAGSTVSTSNSEFSFVQSENIYENLPDKEVDLTIQIRNDNNGSCSYLTENSYLILYRR